MFLYSLSFNSDSIKIKTHPNHVARAAQFTQINLINKKFKIILKTRAIIIILSLSFSFQLAASILKFICSKKLKLKNNIEYCNIIHEFKNFSQKRIIAIICQNTKKSIEKTIENAKKFFVIIDFINFILSISFFATISQYTGNKKEKIGQIKIKGIHIILR